MRLKDLREDNDLLQRDIAEYLKHKTKYLFTIRKRSKEQLPIDVLIKLSEFYKVSTDLLGLTSKKSR